MQTHTISLLNSLADRDAVAYCHEHDLNMALFRLPCEKEAVMYVSEEVKKGGAEDADSGFLFSRFNDRSYSVIEPEYSRRLAVTAGGEAGRVQPECPPMPADYERSVTALVERLRRRGGKTVMAVSREADTDRTLYDIFMSLAAAYPRAFVFCWQCKGSPEAWLGATPEVLAETAQGRLETMALAGTRPRSATSLSWDAKNLEEQAMVRDFIMERCAAHGLVARCSEPFTKVAGPVEHICNTIEVDMPDGFDPFELVADLSPTPAVSGLPRAAALEDIAGLEGLDREYYAGWCGLSGHGTLNLYVTLRCMKVEPSEGRCLLYAGGGITSRSVPADEWAEANAKMSTLLVHLRRP